MPVIRNKSDQIIRLSIEGKIHEVSGRSTEILTREEFSSESVQNLLKKGKIVISSMEEPPKKKWKSEPEETDTSGTEETVPTEESVSEQAGKEPEEMHETEPKKGYARKKK